MTFRKYAHCIMAELKLNTKQYLAITKSVAAAMVLDKHVAELRNDKLSEELSDLWEMLMDRAEDFGMTFPPETEVEDHWSDTLFEDADSDLHTVVDDEFWHLLADRLAERDHSKTCPKAEGEHDEKCFEDVTSRAEGWEGKLEKGDLSAMI